MTELRIETGPSGSPAHLLASIKNANGSVTDTNGVPLDAVQLEREWRGNRCLSHITNTSKEPVRLGNIILFDLSPHGMDPRTPIYGEGFQMLSQTEGTLGAPRDLSIYSDREHYRIPEPDGLRTVYEMMTLDFGSNGHVLLGFSSCKRFIGRFSFDARRLRISVDPEGLALAPGETWQLEEFLALGGNDRSILLEALAQRLAVNHPPLPLKETPTGWCSWYCYMDESTQQIIHENMARFAQILPQLRFIQVDEGYSRYEGDWLDANPAYGDIKASLVDIEKSGFKPALWVAPFIAENDSRVLREHPGWFVRDAEGKPLDSGKVGFGGWRHGPWFPLDGSNPETQKYFENLFRTLRNDWGVTYFKLDANYWGTIHGGRHFDPKATRVEAYRRGMEAVIRGAGPGSVILGCGAPMWPSFGVVNSMRTGNDINRNWDSFAVTARENFNRLWLNGQQWACDPDCVLLAGKDLPANVWQFHATVIHAVGGLVLSGDKAADLTPDRLAMLKRLLPPTGRGARFENTRYHVGVTDLGSQRFYYLFNWETAASDRVIHLRKKSALKDYWNGEDLGIHEDEHTVKAMPGRSARLIIAEDAL